MQERQRPRAHYNVQRFVDDMADRGVNISQLAREAGLSHTSVGDFLTGQHQTAKTAKKMAEALGRSVRRYLLLRAA
jgi:transcriptional regulator with XRE-family HTH domain